MKESKYETIQKHMYTQGMRRALNKVQMFLQMGLKHLPVLLFYIEVFSSVSADGICLSRQRIHHQPSLYGSRISHL